MNKFFMVLVLFIANFILMSSSALAASNPIQYTWDGPPCQGYAICSIDPPPPIGSRPFRPCFTSLSKNPMITEVQINMIGACLAAKNEIIATTKENQDKDMNIMYRWIKKLEISMYNNIPEANLDLEPSSLFPDLKTLNGDWIIYNQEPTATNWSNVQSDLMSIVQDTQTFG